MISIALLGFGCVGSGTAEVLTENKKLIEARLGCEYKIKYILDLRDFPDSPFGDLVVHDFNTILNDPEVSVVAEMMGGSHPAYDFTKACLEAGKSVVTSNKEVVATFGVELCELAAAHGDQDRGLPLTQHRPPRRRRHEGAAHAPPFHPGRPRPPSTCKSKRYPL